VLQGVADALTLDLAALPDRWARIAEAANRSAAADIETALQARGYAQSQIDQWDHAAAWNRDQATFWALTRGGGLASYSDTGVNKLDRRKELATVVLTIGGVSVPPPTPGTGVGGGVSAGTMLAVTDVPDYGR
jgi:hypothetical protein